MGWGRSGKLSPRAAEVAKGSNAFSASLRYRAVGEVACVGYPECGEYGLYSPHGMRRISHYIYGRPDWPKLRWNQKLLEAPLAAVRHRQGRLLGRMESLGLLRKETVRETLTLDVLKSSEIEGEILNREQVRSSVARRLGMHVAGVVPVDRNVEGVVEMTMDATQNFDKPLTAERLFGWQGALFPLGRSGLNRIRVGAWRDDSGGPMQVVSGPLGREHVHYKAVDAGLVDIEMAAFFDWANTPSETEPVLGAAIAHLWFVTVHPFDDGNGRIARAVADWALARSEASPQRFYSMSAQIRLDSNAYYDVLEQLKKRRSTLLSGWNGF